MKCSVWILAVLVAHGPMAPVQAAENEPGLPGKLKVFVAAKEKQIRRVAERVGLEVAPEIDEYFKAARSGDWMQALGLYSSVRNALDGGGGDPDQKSLAAVEAAATLEVQLALELIMESDPALAMKLGEAIVASVPRDSILFGGTDVGRGLPTALSASHESGDPFLLVTQNALADGRYLTYLREMYGGKAYMPSEEDSQQAFQEYLSDAQRRLKHDQDHPDEPKQVKPGEDIRMNKGRVQVSGQVAVMSINAILAKTLFDQNPDRSFFVEESFPLDWMYPRLSPHGMVMKVHREPLVEIPDADVQKDQAYWSEQMRPLVGNWLKPGTSLEEVCAFVKRIHVDRNLAGFEGDRKFLQSESLQKAYGKLRSAIGGAYAWRAAHAKDAKIQARMAAAAEVAFKQALALCPTSPESVFRYANLLLGQKRNADALKLAELAANLDPANGSFESLVSQVQRLQNLRGKQ